MYPTWLSKIRQRISADCVDKSRFAMVVVSEKVEAKEDSSPEEKPVKEKKWGFDLYPERRGDKYNPGVWRILSGQGGMCLVVVCAH